MRDAGIRKGRLVGLTLPRPERLLVLFAAAALLGGLMMGLTAQRAEAAPIGTQTVNPCASISTGEVVHAPTGVCPPGTFAVPMMPYAILCVDMFTKQYSYHWSGSCSAGEFPVMVGGKLMSWGCVHPFTNKVSWVPSHYSACSGQILPFGGIYTCRTAGAVENGRELAIVPRCA